MAIWFEYVSLELDPRFDNDSLNLKGVEILLYIGGSGEGQIKVQWGTYETEIFTIADWGLSFGQNELSNSLPEGTHNVCVSVV